MFRPFMRRLLVTRRAKNKPAARRRRRLAAALLITPLTATVVTARAAAQPQPAPTTSWCATSPVDVASALVPLPARQLRIEVDETAHATDRPTLDVLLQRVELAALNPLSGLSSLAGLYPSLVPGAGDLQGPSPIEVAADLGERHHTVRAVILAHAWGECQP